MKKVSSRGFKPGDIVIFKNPISNDSYNGQVGCLMRYYSDSMTSGHDEAWYVRFDDGIETGHYARYFTPFKITNWRKKLK